MFLYVIFESVLPMLFTAGNYISLDESKESSASGLQIESDVDVLKR